MSEPAATLPSGKAAGPASPAGAGHDAASLAAEFGGNRGGKARKDGLVPGSPEAVAADREKERIRKEQWRARKRAENPPPLPVRAPGDPQPPPPGDLGALPGAQSVPLVAGGPQPWTPESLAPLVDQLISSLEAADVGSTTRKLAKVKQIDGPTLREIERDARWPQASKSALSQAGPRCAAKWMNKTGLSGEYQDEAVIIGAAVGILASKKMLHARIDRLIKAIEEKETPAPVAGSPA